MIANDKPAAAESKPSPDTQGEGDYESSRRFRKDEEQFVKDADVTKLARDAAPKSNEEAAQMKKAEEIGRSHAKGPGGAGPAGSKS